MKTPTAKQFILNNATADIVEVDPIQQTVKYFTDHFGRESSGTSNWQYSFAAFLSNLELQESLKTQFYPQDWIALQDLLLNDLTKQPT